MPAILSRRSQYRKRRGAEDLGSRPPRSRLPSHIGAIVSGTIPAPPLGIPVAAMAATEFSGAKSHDRRKRRRGARGIPEAPPASRRCPCEIGTPAPMKARLVRRSTWLVAAALFAAPAVAWSQAPPQPKRVMLAAESSEAQSRSTRAAAAIVRPRQHDGRLHNRQLPRRPGPADRASRECRRNRGWPDRVCRRSRRNDCRLHPIGVRRSSQAGPHRHARWSRSGVRAQISTAALSRRTAPAGIGQSAVSA